MNVLLVLAAGYLLGSISFGIIVVKLLRGFDIRDYGSGNTGMTNVLRIVGTGPAIAVLIGDALKGVAGVAIGIYFGGIAYGVIGGLAAMVGHTYPVYFGFKGGKGVATGFGVILTLAPDVTIIAIIIFLLTISISRYVSLGSILAALSVAITVICFHKPLPVVVFGLLGASFVIFRHRSNMKRLLQGTEQKIGHQKG